MTAEEMIAAAMRARQAQGFKVVVEMPEGRTAYFATSAADKAEYLKRAAFKGWRVVEGA